MSGIGGDGFIMIYDQKWPNPDFKRNRSSTLRSHFGTLPINRNSTERHLISVNTGLVHSWLDAHEKYGLLPLKEILSPAMDLAENGFPVTHYLAQAIASDRFCVNSLPPKRFLRKMTFPSKPEKFSSNEIWLKH
ncbi:MAG: hypothetical protein Ct9H300mP27_04880 [Chloroflexota bacterium]|nr:MAG: hypothetical protein Ct9H300mP27_04880 [Chloroflexota bacterium]